MNARVRQFQHGDADRAAEVLAVAFHDDPMMSDLVSDESRRARMLPIYFEGVIRQASRRGKGVIRVIEDHSGIVGASITMPPGTYPLPVLPQVREWRAMLVGGGRASVRHFRDLPPIDALRPSEDHEYLMYIGIDPAQQGNGHGRALLGATIDSADESGLPVYLVTQNEKNLGWYAGFGFSGRDHTIMGYAGSSTWTLIRNSPS